MTQSRFASSALFTVLMAFAWLILGVGLLSPLTPSEGLPGLPEIGVFVGLPISLLALAAVLTKGRLLRVFALLQAGAVIAIATWLFGQVLDYPVTFRTVCFITVFGVVLSILLWFANRTGSQGQRHTSDHFSPSDPGVGPGADSESTP